MKKLAKLFYWFLSKRYDVKISGQELLSDDAPRLYLPNHQAEMDPVMLLTIIQRKHKAAPMVSAMYYNIPFLKGFLKLLGAVPVSDLDMGVRDANVMKTIANAANDAFEKGMSILLYPAGHLCDQGYEKIGNKQSVYNIVKTAPDNLKIIGVRIHGFWGSSWSRAWSGISPSAFSAFLKSFAWLLMSLIWFMPKRKLEFEFVDITNEAIEKAKTLKRRDFNIFLEEFYNIRGEEKIRYIPMHFLASKKAQRSTPKNITGVISDNISKIEFIKIK